MAQIKVELNNDGTTKSLTDVRGHAIIIDRPESNGGSNAGPMGGELFLVAIGGCFMSTLAAAAQARDMEIADATCTVVGTFADAPRRFGDLTITVGCSSISSEELEHLIAIADRGCLVLNTLRGQYGIGVAARRTADV